MSEKISDEVFDTLPKKPNFLLVVIISGVVIVVVLFTALLFLSDAGKRLFPNIHRTTHPTSLLNHPMPNLEPPALRRNTKPASS